jgi:Uma2 family endonuclease
MAATALQRETNPEVFYPDFDGEPIAKNSIQYQYIGAIQVGLDAMLARNPDVFVAADLLWYPVEGRPDIKNTTDVMVAFGRPKGGRGSYRQWEEGGLAPQVVFKITSPGATFAEMRSKRMFYSRYGVAEYYEYDPEIGMLEVWTRQKGILRNAFIDDEWRSPLLGVTLKIETNGELSVYRPNGERFLRPLEIKALSDLAEARAERWRNRAERERERAERLAAKLRELGIDPEKING